MKYFVICITTIIVVKILKDFNQFNFLSFIIGYTLFGIFNIIFDNKEE